MDATLTLKRVGIRRRSDDDVFSLALDGDPIAFSEVYRRYHRRIYGYCLACLMDPEAAADAAQEVFLRFLNAPREGIEKPIAWLFAVARNVTTDIQRKRAHTPVATEADVIEGAVDKSAPDAADEFLGREDARNVFIALRQLRPRYRTALILRELHHQSSADMADAFETTPGAVDTIVSRARDAFGRAYGEVADLPSDCREAVAAIYKRKGTGLDAVEESRLDTHLVVCAHCRTEAKRASRLDGLSALLPFLVPMKKFGLSLFERAALSLQSSPDLAAKLGYVIPPERVAPATKVAAGVLALALVATVSVGTVDSRRSSGSPRTGNTATAISRPGGTTGTGGSGEHRSQDASHDSQLRAEHLLLLSMQHDQTSHDTLSHSDSHGTVTSAGDHATSSGSVTTSGSHTVEGTSSTPDTHTSDHHTDSTSSDSHSGSDPEASAR